MSNVSVPAGSISLSCTPYSEFVNTSHCSNKPNAVCDFICLGGYNKNPNIHTLYCDVNGNWSVREGILCEGPFKIHWFSTLIGVGPGVLLTFVFLCVTLVMCRKLRKKRDLYFIDKQSLTNSQKPYRRREVGYIDPETAILTTNPNIEEQRSLLPTDSSQKKMKALPNEPECIEMWSKTDRSNTRQWARTNNRLLNPELVNSSAEEEGEDYEVIDDDFIDEYPGQRQCRTLSCSRVLVHRENKPSISRQLSVSVNVPHSSYTNKRTVGLPLLKRPECIEEDFYSNEEIHRSLKAKREEASLISPMLLDDYQDAKSTHKGSSLTSSYKQCQDNDSSGDSSDEIDYENVDGEDYQNVTQKADYLNLQLRG